MKPSLLNPMSGALRAVLGQAQYNPNLPTRIYGPAHTGSYSSSSPQWSYDDLVAMNRGIQVHDYGFDKTGYFDPTPQAYANRHGICDALHNAFSNGMSIPWKTGIIDIAPGVYFPGKSWEDIVNDSNRVKQNLPQDQSNWQCPNLLIWDKSKNGGKAFCNIGGCGRGDTGCVSSTGYSTKIPSNNRIVLSTATRWVQTYGNIADHNIICTGTTGTQTITDPTFGHKYTVTRTEQLTVANDGTAPVITKEDKGPILFVETSTGTKHPYDVDLLKQDIASGLFPNRNGNVSVKRVYWWDTGTNVSPTQIASTVTGPGPVAAPTTDWAKYIGYGGLAVGGIFILSALLGDKK